MNESEEAFRILIVDDEKHNIDVLDQILSADYDVLVAKNGQSAIRMATKLVPDLILLDIIMPDMSGFEVLAVLKESEVTKEIPVIFITGLDSRQDEEKGLLLGAVDYIPKPFHNSIVKARISTHIQIVKQIRDIEHLRMKADNATKAKSEFLASMSHEIRTPMNAIIGMSELLLQETLSQKQFTYVNDIKTASNALLNIINDILDFSKIEAGKLSLVPAHYNFHQFIENIMSIMHFTANKKNLNFEVKVAEGLPIYLYGDDVRLRQILLNLLSNAIKFTSDGYVRLIVEYGQHDHTLLFTVADSGMGIKEEDIERLFYAFEQADIFRNRNQQGTGLGLSITNGLVAMMNGSINVKSTYGVGTQFFIEIPFEIGDEKQIQKDLESFDFINAPTANILLVDDTKMNLSVGLGLFQLFDITCDTATNGREALEKVQLKNYDIVFMDHLMPIMDGAAATKTIRELGGKYADLIIIALTANAVEGIKEELIASGMNDFLIKPIALPLLNNALKKWLPKEKQINVNKPRVISKSQGIPSDQSILAQVMNLEGLDTNNGLSFVGGIQEAYEQTLKNLSREISDAYETLPCMLDNETNNFIIRIHGLGSGLALAGHVTLSEQAKGLEQALKNGDMTYGKTHLPLFLNQLKSFNDILAPILEEAEQHAEKKKKTADIAYLKEELARIADALADFELDIVKREVDKVLQFKYDDGIQEMIHQLGKAAEVYNYGLIEDIIEKIGRK